MSCQDTSNRAGGETFKYTNGAETDANLGNKHPVRFHLDRHDTDIFLLTVLLYNLLHCKTKLVDKPVSPNFQFLFKRSRHEFFVLLFLTSGLFFLIYCIVFHILIHEYPMCFSVCLFSHVHVVLFLSFLSAFNLYITQLRWKNRSAIVVMCGSSLPPVKNVFFKQD